MQFAKTSFLTFFLCSVLAVVGAVIGLFVGIGIENLRSSSVSVSWKLLDSPVKFAEIVDANTNTAWAKSAEGKLYNWECQATNECKWTETVEVPMDTRGKMTQLENTCQYDKNLTPKNPPGNITECVYTMWQFGEGYGTDYYALLDDGTIWHWSYSVDGYAFIYIVLISIPIGGLLGIMAGAVIMYRKEKMLKEIHRQSYRLHKIQDHIK